MDLGDIAVAQQVWAEQVPELSTYIGAAYGRSASAVGAALYADSGLYVPDPPGTALRTVGVEDYAIVPAAVGGSVPVVARLAIDRAGRDHLAGAVNRLVNAGDAMWMDVRSQLVEGFTAGEGIRDIAARLRSTATVSRARAETIARTEVISASNAGAMAGARALPEIAPAMKTWLATGDGRTRPTHAAADGQEVPLDEPFDVGGYPLDYPGADGPAEEVINCRCTVTFGDPADPGAAADDPEAAVEAATDAEARREAAASNWGVSPEQVSQSMADVGRLRAAVRAEAATVQSEAVGWLDSADAFRIRRMPRGYSGGEYDWMAQLHPAERRRISGNWMDENAVHAPDVVMHLAVENGASHAASVDDFMEQWLVQTRRADAASSLRLGRLPVPNRVGGMTASDISSVLESQGLDISRIVGVDAEEAAGYLASTEAAQYSEQAYSLLGSASTSSATPPWQMSFQSWEAEVRDLEQSISEGRLGGEPVSALTARHAELIPANLDRGQSFEELYAQIVETARVANVPVADWAVIPWTAP